MKRRNVEFIEAMEILAREAGVELRRAGGIPASTRQGYEGAMDAAQAFFREEFLKSTYAQEYCARRGLDAETLSAWELGYSPDVREALPSYLKRRGISLSEAQGLYLVDGDPDAGYSSRFWGRLMFPIRDEKGTLVAFGGRILGDGHPKYINSSDTPLYRKSRVLYGKHRAKDHISKARRAVLCEGYLDVIACHRAGVLTAVASLGTALTDEQARLLKRWCDEVVILYDSDDAGQKAAGRAVDVLKEEGIRIKIALMPEGDDPDTLLKRDGPQAVQRAVEGGLSPTDFRLRMLDLKMSQGSEEYWQLVAEILADEPSNMDFVRHIDRLAGMYPGTKDLELAKKAIQGDVARVRRQKRNRSRAAEEAHFPTPQPRKARADDLTSAELVVLGAFVQEDFRKQAWMFCKTEHFFETGLGVRMSRAIAAAFPAMAPEGEPALWLGRIDDELVQEVLSEIPFKLRIEQITQDYLADTIERLRAKLARRQLRESKNSGADLGEIHKRLKQINPDNREKSDSPDDLF